MYIFRIRNLVAKKSVEKTERKTEWSICESCIVFDSCKSYRECTMLQNKKFKSVPYERDL